MVPTTGGKGNANGAPPGVFASGCGGEKFVTVTGMATRHGKPVPNLAIIFSPEKGLRSFALTDENGKFKMVHSTGRRRARRNS
jgi:hypothetical protein